MPMKYYENSQLYRAMELALREWSWFKFTGTGLEVASVQPVRQDGGLAYYWYPTLREAVEAYGEQYGLFDVRNS